jgi:hypothetical protein
MAIWEDGEKITAARLNNQEVESLIVKDLKVSKSGGTFLVNRVSIAAGASVALETLTGGVTNGLLTFHVSELAASAALTIRAGNNSVTENWDIGNRFSVTDTVNQVCILADGDSSYTIKNTFATAVTLMFTVLGF